MRTTSGAEQAGPRPMAAWGQGRGVRAWRESSEIPGEDGARTPAGGRVRAAASSAGVRSEQGRPPSRCQIPHSGLHVVLVRLPLGSDLREACGFTGPPSLPFPLVCLFCPLTPRKFRTLHRSRWK